MIGLCLFLMTFWLKNNETIAQSADKLEESKYNLATRFFLR